MRIAQRSLYDDLERMCMRPSHAPRHQRTAHAHGALRAHPQSSAPPSTSNTEPRILTRVPRAKQHEPAKRRASEELNRNHTYAITITRVRYQDHDHDPIRQHARPLGPAQHLARPASSQALSLGRYNSERSFAAAAVAAAASTLSSKY